ncbi:MAG: SIMPL domain-containing protein [Caldilineaceae bacterium]|nr:SIMPL domain-containing protein [Caldilineaceae bacterium]
MKLISRQTVVGLVVGLLLLAGVPQLAEAQDTTTTTPSIPNTITVVGEGSVPIEPDIAVVNIGVQVANEDVQAASSEAQEIMNAVLAAIQEQGVAEEDIQTSGFTIFADFGPTGPTGTQPQAPLYRVTNNVNATVRDLAQVPTVLDAAIAAGANNIFGVTFSVDDPSAAASAARAAAIEQAGAKAQELAELTGLQLGGVISVSEIIGSRGGFYGGSGMALASQTGMGGGGGPIVPGQLNVTVQLEVIYGATPAE